MKNKVKAGVAQMIFKMYNDYTIDLSHYNLPIREINDIDDKIKDDFTGIEITHSRRYRFIKEGMIHRVGGPAVVSFWGSCYTELKWYEYGVLSNSTGPAVIRYLPPTEYGSGTEIRWYLDGKEYNYNFTEHSWTLFAKYIREGMEVKKALDKSWECWWKTLELETSYDAPRKFTGAVVEERNPGFTYIYVNGKCDGTWAPAIRKVVKYSPRKMYTYMVKDKISCEFGPAVDYEEYWFNGVKYDFNNCFEGSSFIWYNTVQEMKAGKKFTETAYYLEETKRLDEMKEQKRRQYAKTYSNTYTSPEERFRAAHEAQLDRERNCKYGYWDNDGDWVELGRDSKDFRIGFK